MRSGQTRPLALVLLVASVSLVCWGLFSQADDAAKQPAPAATPADKELDGAVAKVREGKVEEALALIKEKGAKHPEWPVAQLILARMLFAVNQVTAAHRALEQAALLAAEDPEVYLTMGAVALAEGRVSDARLNFEHCQGMFRAGKFVAAKESMLRRECAAGQASVAEAREDWKTTADRLNDWLALEPKNGRLRQRLGRALFMLGKSEDAFKELTQGAKDKPTNEPAAVSMALLFSRKGDVQKAEEWFDYAQKVEPTSARVRLARRTGFWTRGAQGCQPRDRRSREARPSLEGSTRSSALYAPGTCATWPGPKRSSSRFIATRRLIRWWPICWRWRCSSRMTRPKRSAAPSLPM